MLLRTCARMGYARDEGFYFYAANSYGRWFELLGQNRAAAFEQRAIDGAWGVNHEHPALIKSLFVLSYLTLQKSRHLFAMEGTAYRFPAIVLAGALIGLVYLWGAEARGRVAGVAAAVALGSMPHVFFHAHLACFDVPIMTMWTLAAWSYHRSVHTPIAAGGRRWLWPAITGICFGLALDTKHNSWFLPFGLVAHAVAAEVARRYLKKPETKPAPSRLPRAALALGAMALIGPVVFVALWPWIWHDTFRRFVEYAKFHLGHEYYNMELFGQTYWRPPMPRSYAWVMTLATVPTVTLALFGIGVVVRARAVLGKAREDASIDLLWLAGLFINYVAWLSPGTPIFGGTKHWMTAYPFLALFAGVGFDAVVKAARARFFELRRRATAMRALASQVPAALTFGALTFAAPIVETYRSTPWGLSAYTPLVGGSAGAATLGLNRGFWGYQTGAVAPWLNTEALPNASVYIHDTAAQSWDMLLRDGRVRKDLRGAWSVVGADYALYHHEQHMQTQEYQAWVALNTDRPAHLDGLDGVPIIWVYKRKP
jgi:hypothetical protein